MVHELNEVDEIVDKFYPGAICGVKQLFAAGNVAHTTSLLAGTNVEMLELSVTCSEDQFFQVLRKHPARFIAPAPTP